MANEYGKFTAKVYDPVLSPFIKVIRKRVAIEIRKLKPKKIIDLCCGTGHQLLYLKDMDFDEVIGVDISLHMLQVAHKYGVNCINDDASRTQFRDDYFDLAMVSFALHEKSWFLAQSVVNEAKRIVHDDGYFLVVDYYYDEQSRWFGRWTTWMIEFFVGGEHFRNYRRFVKNGGLDVLCKDMILLKRIRILSNSIAISIYKVQK